MIRVYNMTTGDLLCSEDHQAATAPSPPAECESGRPYLSTGLREVNAEPTQPVPIPLPPDLATIAADRFIDQQK